VERADTRETFGDTTQEKGKERGDRGGGQVGNYPGRHYRFGDRQSEERVAQSYNVEINKDFYQRQHQQAINGRADGSPVLVAEAPSSGRSAKDMLDERMDTREPGRDSAARRAALDVHTEATKREMKREGREIGQRSIEEPSRPAPQVNRKRDFGLDR
jgi:hypothetical protein